ncbi:P-loop NTPase fold protein, partial [Klebsiella pneumoniae]|uniref:P-loop NTPase fold protein n=1 Tax=Klebsiella pneumoniae TaxID=573 RepID=UPI002732252E
LLSYDHQTVLDVLEETDLARGNRRRARDYLEKMVQYPFVLPPLQQFHLVEELRTHLKEVARTHKVHFGPSEGYRMDAAEVVFEVYP